MNSANLAVIAVTEFPLMAVALAVVITNHLERMKVAPRVRVVSPPKSQADQDSDAKDKAGKPPLRSAI